MDHEQHQQHTVIIAQDRLLWVDGVIVINGNFTENLELRLLSEDEYNDRIQNYGDCDKGVNARRFMCESVTIEGVDVVALPIRLIGVYSGHDSSSSSSSSQPPPPPPLPQKPSQHQQQQLHHSILQNAMREDGSFHCNRLPYIPSRYGQKPPSSSSASSKHSRTATKTKTTTTTSDWSYCLEACVNHMAKRISVNDVSKVHIKSVMHCDIYIHDAEQVHLNNVHCEMPHRVAIRTRSPFNRSEGINQRVEFHSCIIHAGLVHVTGEDARIQVKDGMYSGSLVATKKCTIQVEPEAGGFLHVNCDSGNVQISKCWGSVGTESADVHIENPQQEMRVYTYGGFLSSTTASGEGGGGEDLVIGMGGEGFDHVILPPAEESEREPLDDRWLRGKVVQEMFRQSNEQ